MDKDWRNELITKGAAFDALTEVESQYEFEDGHDHLMGWAKTKIFALPSAQPERIKGRWIGYAGTIGAECSECHKWLDVIQGTAEMNYCPNCGADMREGEEDAAD